MTKRQISFELKNDPGDSDKLHQHMANFAKQVGLSKKVLFQINFAVDELFTNIVSYGYTDGKEHTIHIRVTLDNDILTLCIKDDGQPFNPETAESPNPKLPPEKRKIGGLGIFLTKKLMDHVSYERRGNTNVFTMTKYLKAPADTG
jgi:serine/threonine-protein kinase RsbW